MYLRTTHFLCGLYAMNSRVSAACQDVDVDGVLTLDMETEERAPRSGIFLPRKIQSMFFIFKFDFIGY